MQKLLGLAAMAFSIGLVLALFNLPPTSSGFSAVTDNTSNSWSSGNLAPPSSLVATGGTSVALTWTISPDTWAQAHRVFRSNTPGGPYTLVAQLTPRTANMYVDTPPPGTYYYVVRAWGLGWESANSNEESAVVNSPSSDYDAVPTVSDNCPSDFNINQFDTDGDGVGDACDSEPTVGSIGVMVDSGQALGSIATKGLAVGDFDGDGDLDVTFAQQGPNEIWFNDGTGTFTLAQSLGNADSWGAAVGDLDADGDLDITYSNNGANTVWLNNGSGVFTNSGQALGTGDGDTADLGDFDDDGDLDVRYGNKAADRLWLNNGSGVFTDSGQSLDGGETRGSTVGDVDGDGDLDLINGNKNSSHVWLNNGAGGFTDSGQTLAGADSTELVDVDGDGDNDIVFGQRGGSANSLWLNNGSGVFTDSGQGLGGGGYGLAVGDFDGDGDVDLAFGTDSGANTLYLNNGSGVFSDSGQTLELENTRAVASGDLDGDGDLDLIYATDTANTVWFNFSVPLSCPADPDLRLCLDFNTDVAGTYPDASGNANDVAHTNGSLISGISGKAIDQTASSRYEIADSASLDLTTAMTLETWARFDSLPSTGRASLLDNDGQYSILYYAGTGLRCSNGPDVLFYNSVSVETWFHVACSWNGATFTMYINGVSVASAAAAGPSDPSNTQVIGLLDNSPLFTEPMDGAIDNLQIWSVGRTQTQICADSGVSGC